MTPGVRAADPHQPHGCWNASGIAWHCGRSPTCIGSISVLLIEHLIAVVAARKRAKREAKFHRRSELHQACGCICVRNYCRSTYAGFRMPAVRCRVRSGRRDRFKVPKSQHHHEAWSLLNATSPLVTSKFRPCDSTIGSAGFHFADNDFIHFSSSQLWKLSAGSAVSHHARPYRERPTLMSSLMHLRGVDLYVS